MGIVTSSVSSLLNQHLCAETGTAILTRDGHAAGIIDSLLQCQGASLYGFASEGSLLSVRVCSALQHLHALPTLQGTCGALGDEACIFAP